MPVLSETHFLEIVDRHFPNQHDSLILGRGDDCAILHTKDNICLSTDLFLENVHFRRAYFHASDIGYKSLAVNISDIAAMGARPRGFSLGLGLPSDVSSAWLEDFFSGMSKLAHEHHMVLAGGDVTSSPFIHICITIWGDAPKSLLKVEHEGQRKFLTRGGAMPHDIIFIVGKLGLARIGLSLLETQGRQSMHQWPMAYAAHLHPEPLVNAGLIIRRVGIKARPPVLMDVSDGLARDLPRLLGMDTDLSGPLGADISLTENLLAEEVLRYNKEKDLCPITEAWLGGEDYALLGACAPNLFPTLRTVLRTVQQIGTINETGKIKLNGLDVNEIGGFDHFA